MRKALAAVGLVLVAATLVRGEKEIEPDALLGHIKFLSADDLKGRGNGSDGLERAADYIAEQFKSAGLQPGVNGSWFQPFELNAGLAIGPTNSLSFQARGRTVTLTLGTSYYPLAASGSDKAPSVRFDGLPLVFAGYGLAIPELGYDDYKNIDVAGKAVIIFTHEPQEHDAGSRLNGTRPMPQTSLNAKAQLALSKGARMLIAVSDQAHRYDEGQFSLFKSDPDADDQGLPVLRVRRTEMQPLLDAWRLDATARLIDMDLIPRSEVLTGATVNYVESISKNRRTVRNVIGILPGSDPARAREAIVIGAHYDHVGLGGRLSVTPDRVGEIHNGADDNASGTASIIEMARAAVGGSLAVPADADLHRLRWRRAWTAGIGVLRGARDLPHREHHRDAQPRHGGPRPRWCRRQRTGRVAVNGSRPEGRCRCRRRRPSDQARRPGRRTQRRLQLPRSPDPGDQLLHRLPRRLPPSGR